MRTPIESYVVRIYRCRGGTKRQLVGLVEAPRLCGPQAFTTVEQLWEIMSKRTRVKQAAARAEPDEPSES